jgi:UBX domain-containing protein 7
MAENDELVSQFLSFTGSADTDRAASYLEMCNGNLETAVGLYMEHQGGLGGGGARAMSDGLPGASAHDGFDGGIVGDDIRAPDATRTMRLMDDAGLSGGVMGMLSRGGHPYMGMDPMFHEQNVPSAFARDAVNSAAVAAALDTSMGDGNDSIDDNADEEEKEESKRKSPPSVAGLADMFAAPQHLMYTEGGFEGARTMAKDTKRWLLVNLQKDSEFSCHALNRDVWRDELVENLIREGFIFWQTVSLHMNFFRKLVLFLAVLTLPSSMTVRWISHLKDLSTHSDTKYMIIHTLESLIHARAVSCGKKKVGHSKSRSPQNNLQRLPWIFVPVTLLINPLKRLDQFLQ